MMCSEKSPLVILGKAPVIGKKGLHAHDDWPGCVVWTVGTAEIDDADRYFEFHGLEYRNREMTRTLSKDVSHFAMFLPLNNSVCAMLVQAYLEGYKDITIAGCPMKTCAEYIEQARAVAMCVGFFNGMTYANPLKKIKVTWLEGPKKENYFENHSRTKANQC